MIKAISDLATLLDTNRDMPWKVGPLGHGLHDLAHVRLFRVRRDRLSLADPARAADRRQHARRPKVAYMRTTAWLLMWLRCQSVCQNPPFPRRRSS